MACRRPGRPEGFTEVAAPGRLSRDLCLEPSSSGVTTSVGVFYSLKEALEYRGKFHSSPANVTDRDLRCGPASPPPCASANCCVPLFTDRRQHRPHVLRGPSSPGGVGRRYRRLRDGAENLPGEGHPAPRRRRLALRQEGRAARRRSQHRVTPRPPADPSWRQRLCSSCGANEMDQFSNCTVFFKAGIVSWTRECDCGAVWRHLAVTCHARGGLWVCTSAFSNCFLGTCEQRKNLNIFLLCLYL